MESNREEEIEFSKFKLDYAITIYENERKREENTISQASRMLTVNSIILTALFVVADIVYRSNSLSFVIFILIFASITTALGLSICFATVSQIRTKREDFSDIEQSMKIVDQEKQKLIDEVNRNESMIQLYSKLQKAVTEKIEKRQLWLNISTIIFYIALSLCAIWFIVAMIII